MEVGAVDDLMIQKHHLYKTNQIVLQETLIEMNGRSLLHYRSSSSFHFLKGRMYGIKIMSSVTNFPQKSSFKNLFMLKNYSKWVGEKVYWFYSLQFSKWNIKPKKHKQMEACKLLLVINKIHLKKQKAVFPMCRN